MNELTYVMALLSKQKVVGECTHKGWRIKCFFGPSSLRENVLEHSACAITDDIEKAQAPVLPKNNCIQVIFDNRRSVIWWNASTKSVLTRKIKRTLANFNWRSEHDRIDSDP